MFSPILRNNRNRRMWMCLKTTDKRGFKCQLYGVKTFVLEIMKDSMTKIIESDVT